MTVAFAHDHVAATGHGRNNVTRLDGQDLVGIAVEQQQRFAA
jgi:hypothetical protein